MPGFERNRFTDLSEREAKHLSCSICLNIYDNAIRSECDHTFCKSCVHQCIDSNKTDCPECRQKFSAKRKNHSRNNSNLIIISNFVFKSNRTANDIISELKIKCKYDYNGCQQSVKLDSLSSHMKECPHKFCAKCGLIFGENAEHNCIELLKNDRNDFKKKYENQLEVNNKLKEEIIELKTKLQTNEDLLKRYETKILNDKYLSDYEFICQSIEYIVFGTYKTTTIKNLTIDSDFIRMTSIKLNHQNLLFGYNLSIPFIDCQLIMYCNDPSLRLIIVKPNPSSCQKIQEKLLLGDNSPNDYKFDVNSNDSKHRYIIIVFKAETQMFENCIQFLELAKSKTKVHKIAQMLAKDFIENTIIESNH